MDTVWRRLCLVSCLVCVPVLFGIGCDNESPTQQQEEVEEIIDDFTSNPDVTTGINITNVGVSVSIPQRVTFTFSLEDDGENTVDIESDKLRKSIKVYESSDGSTYSEVRGGSDFSIARGNVFTMDIALVLGFNSGIRSSSSTLQNMTEGAKGIVDALADNQRVAVVEYHDQGTPEVIHPLGFNHNGAKDAIDNYKNSNRSGSMTCYWNGVVAGIQAVENSNSIVRAVVTVTDGSESACNHMPEQVRQMAEEKGIRLYFVGYGINEIDKARLEKVAEATGGAFAYAGSGSDISAKLTSIRSLLTSDRYTVSYISSQKPGQYTIKLKVSHNDAIDEYPVTVDLSDYAPTGLSGKIDIPSVNKSSDGTATFSLTAEYLTRVVQRIEFSLETKKEVEILKDNTMCENWSVSDDGNNNFIMTGPALGYGTSGPLFEIRIKDIQGSGLTVPLTLNIGNPGNQPLEYPSTLIVGSGGLPPVAIAGPDTVVGTRDTVLFHGSANSENEIREYAWKIWTGFWIRPSEGDTALEAPAKGGTYVCSLRVTDVEGKKGYDAFTVGVDVTAPLVELETDSDSAGFNDPVALMGTVTDDGEIVRYEWKIGDAWRWTEGSGPDTIITTPSETTTVVCSLRVTDNDEEVTRVATSIRVVSRPPKVRILVKTETDTSVGIGDDIALEVEAFDEDSIAKYEWKFGADSWYWIETSTSDTTIRAPSAPGDFICSLKVTDADGEAVYETVKLIVTGEPPKIDLGNDTTVGINDTIILKARVQDPDGIAKYEWKCGDDWNWSETSEPELITTAPSTAQFYVCSLRVTDNDELVSYDAKTVRVLANEPKAGITAKDTRVGVRDTVYLQGQAEDDGDIVEWAWKFGTQAWGNPWIASSRDTAVAAPDTGGVFVCSLRITDDDEQYAYATISINVESSPPTFRVHPTEGYKKDGDTLIFHVYDVRDNGNLDSIKVQYKAGRYGTWIDGGPDDTITVFKPQWEDVFICSVRVRDDDYEYGYAVIPVRMFRPYDRPTSEGGTMLPIGPDGGKTFTMGSTYSDTEKVVHDVTFSYNFKMDKYEMRQGVFDSVMNAVYNDGGSNNYQTPSWQNSPGRGNDYPAYNMTWFDAILFCNALSRIEGKDTVYRYTERRYASKEGTRRCIGLTGLGMSRIDTAYGYRLPTEAEWEYAVKGGNNTDFPWGDSHTGYGNYVRADANTMVRVDAKYPDGYCYGLHNMVGNAKEWCWDVWRSSYPGGSVTNPTGPAADSTRDFRVTRGGSFWMEDDQAADRNRMRCTYRATYRQKSNYGCCLQSWDLPDDVDADRGFRIAVTVKP